MVRAWRTSTEEFKEHYVKPIVKHGGGYVMVMGCFFSSDVGKLVFIERIMRKEDYFEILKSFILESAVIIGLKDSFIFKQDNDPKHTARIVTNWINENGIDKFLWITQSPHLNPIENLWDMVGCRINRNGISRISDLKSKKLDIKKLVKTLLTAR